MPPEAKIAAAGVDPAAQTASVDPEGLDPRAVYKLLIGSIVPRPIAWVSSLSADGIANLAPFSFFTIVSTVPPMVSVTFVRRGHSDETPDKDTLANIKATGEYAINVVPASLAQPMARSSHPYEADVDEFERVGLTPVESELIAAPQVAEAPISMECRLETTVRPGSDTVAIGRVLRFHFRGGLLLPNGRIDVETLDPLGRLAGDYASISTPFPVPLDPDEPLTNPNA
jgi:flavin reductase (DIM6/NTAB) family NADH-FMN oxidoreductase RutF